MNENNNNYEIDVLQIIGMVLKRWWIVAIAAVLCALTAFGYSKLMVTPIYEANATLLINSGTSVSTTYQEILSGQYQSRDYPYILKAGLTLEGIAEKLNSYDFSENDGVPYRTYTAGVLSSMISSVSVDDSRIFIINVNSPNPDEARIVANAVVEVFPQKIEELIRGGSVGIVDLAQTPTSPVSPNYSSSTFLGLMVGFIIGVVITLAIGFINDTIESENWIMTTFKDDIPLLTVIPDTSSSSYRYDKYSRYRYKYGQTYGSRPRSE